MPTPRCAPTSPTRRGGEALLVLLVLGQVEAVDPAVLLAYIRDPRLRRQPATGDSLEQLIRRELPPVLVDMLLQPAEQVSKLTTLDLRVEVGDVGSDLLHQLRGDDVAERVAGKLCEA